MDANGTLEGNLRRAKTPLEWESARLYEVMEPTEWGNKFGGVLSPDCSVRITCCTSICDDGEGFDDN